MDTSTARPLCKGKTKNGQPCQGYAVSGSEYCFSHDPASAAQRAESRRKGGMARHGRIIGKIEPDEPQQARQRVTLDSPAAALKLIERACNDVLRLENSVNRNRVLIAGAVAFTKLYEVSELAARLEAMEKRLDELQKTG